MAAVLGESPDQWQQADHAEFQYDYMNVLVVLGAVFSEGHPLITSEVDPDRSRGSFVNEQSGPVQNWESFERFGWPRPEDTDFSAFNSYRSVLPKGMKTNAVVSCGYFSKVV